MINPTLELEPDDSWSIFEGEQEEARQLRDRQAFTNALVDRYRADAQGTVKQLVQCFKVVEVPTSADKFAACHPCSIAGDQHEGGTDTITPNTAPCYYVDILGGAVAYSVRILT